MPGGTGQYSIIVHGGAWKIPAKLTERSLSGVRRAAKAGYAVLESGGTAVDAVQAAVVVLEDDPAFDAGMGSCLNAARAVEMDAVIVSEDQSPQSLKAGAVAAVSKVKNPVCLARRVMETTKHSLLVGPNADHFAVEASAHDESVVIVKGEEELVSAEAVAEWEEFNKYESAVTSLFNGGGMEASRLVEPLQSGHDTVGAVAIDSEGRMAAATSTGGITMKLPGRVGDSPILGSGAYVDATCGAASTTGHGESIMKAVLAKHALMIMGTCGKEAEEAAAQSLKHMLDKTGGCVPLCRSVALRLLCCVFEFWNVCKPNLFLLAYL